MSRNGGARLDAPVLAHVIVIIHATHISRLHSMCNKQGANVPASILFLAKSKGPYKAGGGEDGMLFTTTFWEQVMRAGHNWFFD